MTKFAVVVVAFVGVVAVAGAAKKVASTIKTENCGAMMKAEVPLPTKMSELMTNVADGMDAHAAWVGASKDPAAIAEAAAFKKLADDHRTLATEMKKAADDMDAASKLAPAPHDMAKADPKAADALTKRVTLEREMAALIVADADKTAQMIQSMKTASAK